MKIVQVRDGPELAALRHVFSSRIAASIGLLWVTAAGSGCTDQPVSASHLNADGRLMMQLQPHAAQASAPLRAESIEVQGVVAASLTLAGEQAAAGRASGALYLHMRLSGEHASMPARFVWTNLQTGRQEVHQGPVFAGPALVPVSQIRVLPQEKGAAWRVEVFAADSQEPSPAVFAQVFPPAGQDQAS